MATSRRPSSSRGSRSSSCRRGSAPWPGPLGALALAADAESSRRSRRRSPAPLAMSERSGKHMRLSGTNLERAGDHNQRVTLHAIRVNGPITRAELAKITGLTAPAIANITKRLLNDSLIQDAGRRRGGRGQPATKLVINPDSWFSIGLNVDRDHITMVVLDFEGRVRARASREVELRDAEGRGEVLPQGRRQTTGEGRHRPRPAGGHRRGAAGRHAQARRCRTSRPTTASGVRPTWRRCCARRCPCRCSWRTTRRPRPWARCSSGSARNTRRFSTS